MKTYLIKYSILFVLTTAVAVLASIHVFNYNLDLAGISILVVLTGFVTLFEVWLLNVVVNFFTGKSART